MILFLVELAFSLINYELTDCQTTITYKGSGTLTNSDAENAFGKKKIILCEGITEISSYAFSQTSFASSALQSFIYEEIELPCSLETIGDYAFQNYYSELRKIHFPDYPYSSYTESSLENYYALRSIGCKAFNKDYKIICHNIPPTFKTMYPYTFSSCSIKHIGINSDITAIPPYAFQNCGLRSIKLHCLVNQIVTGAFYNCSQLTSIVFEDIIEITIFSSVFYNCTSLQQVNFPTNVHFYKSDYLFYNCFSLRSVTMPKYLRNNFDLPEGMFRNCISLKYCSLPENIQCIERYMFQNTSLESIYIPESVSYIYEYSFADCLNLKYVEVNTSKRYSHVNFYNNAFDNTPNVKIMVVRGQGSHYFQYHALTGSTFCLLDPAMKYYSSRSAFENPTVVYSTQEYKNSYSTFNGYNVNVVYNGVCDIPRQTPYPTYYDYYDNFPWSNDCYGYNGAPGCGGGGNNNYPTQDNYYPSSSSYSRSYGYSTPTRNPIYEDKDQSSDGKKKKGLSGGAIAGIVIACIVVVVVVVSLCFCGCFVTSYKKQVYNSKGSDSGEIDSTETDPEKPNSNQFDPEKPNSNQSDPEKPNIKRINQENEPIQSNGSVLDNSP